MELSSKCTLKCPRCPRTELHPDNLNKELSFDDFKRAFSAEQLSSIKRFAFCGDLGDPIYCTDFLDIVRYIKSTTKISLLIVTNGSYKKQDWWAELGSLLTDEDTVTFSVDGWDQESNEKYRVNSDWDSITLGIRTLKDTSNCRLKWSAIHFAFNEEHMDKIKELASSFGMDEFQTVESTKFDGRYLVDGHDPLKPKLSFSSTGQYNVSKIRFHRVAPMPIVTTPMRNAHEWARCLRGEKEMFINVEGLVFPCPWFNSGYQQNDFVETHKDKLSIKSRTLTDILTDPIWDEFMTRIETMPLEVCRIKCKDAR